MTTPEPVPLRRRVIRLARLLPLIGALLLGLPALWHGTAGVTTAHVMIYVFSVWAGLILTAAISAHALPRRARTPGPDKGA